MKRYLLKSFIAIAIWFVAAGAASAQEVSLQMFPPVVEVASTTGRTFDIAFILENRADPTIVRLMVSGFMPEGSRGGVRLIPADSTVLFSIDKVPLQEQEPIFMKSGEKREIRVTVTVSPKAEEKDYYYTLIAKSEPVQNPSQTSVLFSTGVGSHLLLSITDSGKLGAKGTITKLSIDKRPSLSLFGNSVYFINSFQDIPLTLHVENTGVYAIKPRGKLTIKGLFGDKSLYDIEPRNVLAKSHRLITSSGPLDKNCKSDEECRNATLFLGGYLLGYYRVGTTIDFGEGTPTLSKSIAFMVVPFQMGWLFLLGVVLLGGLLFKRRIGKKTKLHDASF